MLQVTSIASDSGCSATDRLNIPHQSEAAPDDNTGGGATADGQSTDEPESTTSAKNTEPCQGGGEAVCGSLGSDSVNMETASTPAGSETVSDEKGIEAAREAVPVEKHQCDTEAADKVDDADDKPTASSEATGATTSSAAGAASAEKNVDSTAAAVVGDFLALTYLVHPPDGSTFDRPYADDFWRTRWVRMEPEIRRMLRKSSRLASDVITLGSSDSSSDYDGTSADDDDDGGISDYEDSLAESASPPSPIFVTEKKGSAMEEDREKDFCEEEEDEDEIILDESSSHAILVADDDDDGDDDNDEIICSGAVTNEDGSKKSDSSIVICEADNSVDGSSQPSAAQPHDVQSRANLTSSVPGKELRVDPVDTSDITPDAGASAACSETSTTQPQDIDTAAGCSRSGAGMDSLVESGTDPGRGPPSSQPVDSVAESLDPDVSDQHPQNARNGSTASLPPPNLLDDESGKPLSPGKPASDGKPVSEAGASSVDVPVPDHLDTPGKPASPGKAVSIGSGVIDGTGGSAVSNGSCPVVADNNTDS